MRFLLAVLRTWSVQVSVGATAVLVATAWMVGDELLRVPFLTDLVEAGRVFPALLAGAGVIVVATDWRDLERTGCRSVTALTTCRVVAGAGIAIGGAVLVRAANPDFGIALVAASFAVLTALALLFPRWWWWAMPVLLHAQLFLPPDFLLL